MGNLIINRHLVLQIEFRKMSLHNQSDAIPVGKRVVRFPHSVIKDLLRDLKTYQGCPKQTSYCLLPSPGNSPPTSTELWLHYSDHSCHCCLKTVSVTRWTTESTGIRADGSCRSRQGDGWRAPLKTVVPMTHEFLWPYSWILTSREAFRQWTIISEDFLPEF